MTRRTASTRRRRRDAGTGKGADGNGERPRVVVVGGGFAGLSAVRELGGADVEVLLLDRDLYNTFQPLLYQVATGGLNPGDVTHALRAFAARHPNAQFRRMAVSGVDAERRCVRTDDGEEIGYDYLILCCGVTANYFGIPGAAEHAWTVYTRKAAIEVRDRMLGSAATIWATGVKVHDQVAGWGLPQGRGGRIQVAPDMRVVGHPESFAVGDVAASVDGALPQLALPAIQGGRHAAVVQLPRRVKLRGRVAWLAWVGLHIVMLVGHRNRLATLANLSVRYLAWPGRLNVIMGDPP